MIIKLNFAQERLQVDVLNEVISLDDGSSLAAQAAAQVSQFQFDHFRNGILEIWNSVTNKPLGRCDAFLPCNVDMARSVANFEATIRAINAEANRRRATEASEFPGSN